MSTHHRQEEVECENVREGRFAVYGDEVVGR